MRSYRINLLQRKELPIVSRLFYFGLHYLRYIIVITQIIVIGVFFYRFKVDQEIIDLQENVNQKQEIFKITLPLVEEAKAIELRSNYVSTILDNQESFYDDSSLAFESVPQGIQITDFQVSDTIRITGIAISTTKIKQYVDVMNRSKKYTEVSIATIAKKDSGYEFTINIKR